MLQPQPHCSYTLRDHSFLPSLPSDIWGRGTTVQYKQRLFTYQQFWKFMETTTNNEGSMSDYKMPPTQSIQRVQNTTYKEIQITTHSFIQRYVNHWHYTISTSIYSELVQVWSRSVFYILTSQLWDCWSHHTSHTGMCADSLCKCLKRSTAYTGKLNGHCEQRN